MEKDQLGFKTLPNGLAVLQCCGWTDSAFPVFFIEGSQEYPHFKKSSDF